MARTLQHAWPQRARCDHCGRECEVSSEWWPRKCPYCGQVHFLPDSRARTFAVCAALAAVALFTAVAWLVLG